MTFDLRSSSYFVHLKCNIGQCNRGLHSLERPEFDGSPVDSQKRNEQPWQLDARRTSLYTEETSCAAQELYYRKWKEIEDNLLDVPSRSRKRLLGKMTCFHMPRGLFLSNFDVLLYVLVFIFRAKKMLKIDKGHKPLRQMFLKSFDSIWKCVCCFFSRGGYFS